MSIQKLFFNGVTIEAEGIELTFEEVSRLLEKLYADEPSCNVITSIKVKKLANGKILVDYDVQPPKFERIRRITGYLTGTLDTWNDSKKAEEKERVKHRI